MKQFPDKLLDRLGHLTKSCWQKPTRTGLAIYFALGSATGLLLSHFVFKENLTFQKSLSEQRRSMDKDWQQLSDNWQGRYLATYRDLESCQMEVKDQRGQVKFSAKALKKRDAAQAKYTLRIKQLEKAALDAQQFARYNNYCDLCRIPPGLLNNQ